MLRMFAYDINIIICRECGIRYIFKYVCKGHNRLTVQLNTKNDALCDKVKNFQYCHYIWTPETLYRMVKYDIIEAKTTVRSLEVNIYDIQEVYFRQDQNREPMKRQNNETKLPLWFSGNRKFPNAKHLKYGQYMSCFQ